MWLFSFLRNIKHFVTNIKFINTKKLIDKKNLVIYDEGHTVDSIIRNGSSVCRFGDGEFRWMTGINNNSFQENNDVLSYDLRRTLKNFSKTNTIICISRNIIDRNAYNTDNNLAWKKLLNNYWPMWENLLDTNKDYYDANFTRPYIDRKNKKDARKRFLKLKDIWQNKNILIVEGVETRFGVNNDLLDNCKCVKRILCPAENAFDKYNDIFSAVYDNISNFDIVLIALGPTATVLAYDLSSYIQAIDIGHVDIEYEWFLLKAKKRVPIKNKYTNEVNSKDKVSQFRNIEYENQIIARVL